MNNNKMKQISDWHNGSILGGAPEHEGDVGRRGESLDASGVAAEHVSDRGVRGRIDVVHSDLTVGRPSHNNRVIRVRQELQW